MAKALQFKVWNFWFKDLAPNAALPSSCMQRWFGGSKELDDEIKRQFSADVETLLQEPSNPVATELKQTAPGVLTLIILLDQFTRNIYRSTPKAFAGDPIALKLTLEAMEKKLDGQLDPIPRTFLYMPLEHSENLVHQSMVVDALTRLHLDSQTAPYEGTLKSFVEFAKRHRVVVEKFGRFPHRNEILGRKPTPEEEEYLKSGGDRF